MIIVSNANLKSFSEEDQALLDIFEYLEEFYPDAVQDLLMDNNIEKLRDSVYKKAESYSTEFRIVRV
jgi:hypothetical protein